MKIIFIQNKGRSFGGVWQVNKTVGEALIRDGYDVTVLSIRENKTGYEPVYDKRMRVETLNTKDAWETYSWSEILNDLKKFKCGSFIRKARHRLYNNKTINEDKKKLSDYLDNLKPDYIISSQYQILDLIPKKYLPITFHEQHSSFKESWNHSGTRKVLLKYKDKVKYIWLCKNSMNMAINHGLSNSICIYNAVRFETKDKADVIKNKKLITIARLSSQKRIDKMINIVEEIFKGKKYQDWKFEIWGDGEEYDKLKSLIHSSQIKLMGRTNDPQKVLLTSSINLITSDFEGFALSILEANECGIPTITYDFGESTEEEVIDGKTGFIAKDKNDFINKLKMLMDDKNLLNKISNECKKYNDNFKIKNIVKDWEKIFK